MATPKIAVIGTTEADSAGPAGDPQEAWQCNYCANAGQCAYRIKKRTPKAADDK